MRRTTVVCAMLGATLAIGIQRAEAATLPPGCGPDAVQFKVKTDKGVFAGSSEPGKAQLVFLQTLDGEFSAGPVSRFAVDGSWVGAAKGASYFAVEVAPGDHEICASRQSSAKLEKANLRTLKIQAQAGQTYVYQFTIQRSAVGSPEMRVDAFGVPGSSMTAKNAETIDNAELTTLPPEDAKAVLTKLPRAISTQK